MTEAQIRDRLARLRSDVRLTFKEIDELQATLTSMVAKFKVGDRVNRDRVSISIVYSVQSVHLWPDNKVIYRITRIQKDGSLRRIPASVSEDCLTMADPRHTEQ